MTSSGSNGPLQANKKHSFHNWRGKERREALSIPGAERSPEGRGSEHGALLVYAPRGAAQAGLTGGADRSSRLRRETNVRKEDQPKAVPLNLEVENLVLSGHVCCNLGSSKSCQRVGGTARKRVKSDRSWIRSVTKSRRHFRWKGRVLPGHPNRAQAATQSECAWRHSSSDWRNAGGHGKAGMESEEGTEI